MQSNLLPLKFDAYTRREDRILTIYYKDPLYAGLQLFVHSQLDLPYSNIPPTTIKRPGEDKSYFYNVYKMIINNELVK